ncbi:MULTISPECIES: hypothetical protein [Amycolatopsis]|uniref:hypothetical protein n=1 Tax=Amycolatopsis sp. cg13 TaxID=3238807 RepID=UPI00352664EB
MSTSDGTPFFPASGPDRDGTLAGDAGGERFSDPLSGFEMSSRAPRPLPTAKPVEHDPEAVKRMVEAALKEEAKKKEVVKTPNPIPPSERPDLVPLGLLPRQRTWPTKAPQLLKKVPRPRPKRVTEIADDDIEEELAERQSRRGMPSLSMPSFGRPSSSTAGVVLAVVLLIVFGIVAIELIASLVSSVKGLFG